MGDPFQIVGTSLEGKYRIDQVVGEGGFGVVYRGYHLSFEHAIAIKCLKVPPHFTPAARELFLTKFREEGKHLSRLGEHPSITRVYDFGIVERAVPIPYLVLEWLDGDDLEQLLAKRRAKGDVFSEIEALQLLRPAIDALSLAHGLGIAHRDIKPPNLYWAKGVRGRVLKVLDFGIAKAMAEGDTATQIATKTSSGFSAFSPSYGAPEQFRAKKFGATGPWTDVHAIGLLLAEMVAGRAAFEGDEMIEFYEQCSKETRPTARVLGAETSDEFEALCQKALALSPKDRYATAGELLAAVDRLLEGARPLVLDDARPGEKKATAPIAASEPNATVAQAPLEMASTSAGVGPRPKKSKKAATVAAEPLAAPGESSGTVLAEPLEVGRAPKTARPDPTSPARLALGTAAVIALVGVVYMATRGLSSDKDGAAHPTATASGAVLPAPTVGPAPDATRESEVGALTVVDIGVKATSLKSALLREISLAETTGKQVLVMLTDGGECPPCRAVSQSLSDPRMQAALEKTRLVRVDVDVFDDHLALLRYPPNPIPGFFLIDREAAPRDGITSAEWDEDIADNIAPVVHAFVRGQLTVRKTRPLRLAAPADVAAPPADATKTASGLAYTNLMKGNGTEHPAPTDEVKASYTGWTTRGKMFDTSERRREGSSTVFTWDGEPVRFTLDQVIPGWSEGVQLMVVGDKMRFWIPAALAFGDQPDEGRPAGMLVFDIELVEIIPRTSPPAAPGTGSADAPAARGASARLPPAVADPHAGPPRPPPAEGADFEQLLKESRPSATPAPPPPSAMKSP